ncbi:hypothetical protein [Streptomyces sp. NRRL WC-3742]|uniref:hypothetical protein n=1 Tax=Streptomyces sp. NRRL WC-3742 TaxID=1463934 RepID=UPI0004C790D2|nr:hypothetical protein [Streptomyces sp. NRRL WC-3742]
MPTITYALDLLEPAGDWAGFMRSGRNTVHPAARGAAWDVLEELEGTGRAAVVYTLARDLTTTPYALVAWQDGEPVALVTDTANGGAYVVAWEDTDNGRRYCRSYPHPRDAMGAVDSARSYVNVRLVGYSPNLDELEWRR